MSNIYTIELDLRSFKYVHLNHPRSCQVPFYTLSIRTQKILLILILQTTRPCNFSIRRIIVSSHELFAKVSDNLLIVYFLNANVNKNVLQLIHTSVSFAMLFFHVL